MKSVRIGTGSGGCSYERIEPAIELLEKGNLNYLVFECLAERTIANAHMAKLANPRKGYNPMLQERMTKLLPMALANGVKIVSNMGGANTPLAVEEVCHIAKSLGLGSLKVGMVQGDDITHMLDEFAGSILLERNIPLRNMRKHTVFANVYLDGGPIKEALSWGADIVITGRVADPALFAGPLMHEFGAACSPDARLANGHGNLLGQSLLLGHLMECAGQLTGGYFADPGYKDVPDLHRLGLPIAELCEDGRLFFSKVEGTGGLLNEQTCKEQLLYEIGDPARYITPDGIVDFSQVTFAQLGKDHVSAGYAIANQLPETFKVNVGYMDSYMGEAGISYGGSNALARARLAADIVEKRLKIIGLEPEEYRVDYIGYNSLYKEEITRRTNPTPPSEVRLRIAARTRTEEEAIKVVREVECLYINGPAGGGGIRSKVSPVLSVDNILIPREAISPVVTCREV